MAQGLQIWDSFGEIVLDLTDRVGIIAGSVQTNSQNGSVVVQGLDDSQGVFFFSIQSSVPDFNTRHLVISSSGKVISWNYVADNAIQSINPPATIYYGAY